MKVGINYYSINEFVIKQCYQKKQKVQVNAENFAETRFHTNKGKSKCLTNSIRHTGE